MTKLAIHALKFSSLKKVKFTSLQKGWPLLLIVLAWWITEHFGYAVNVTHSLPQRFWIIHYGKTPKRFDYVLFKVPKETGYPENTTAIKQVLGVPGDLISRKAQDFFINNQYVATAKRFSLKQEPLTLGPQGILKEGQFYVSTPHQDSFDSRYQKMGWIEATTCLGIAYPIW